jgi:hypothetical protein
MHSANGREYPPAVFRRDFAKYEGRPVNCDHDREATVDRRLGWFVDVKPCDDGRPRGTLHLLKSHPMYERVMEAAERNPKLFGFSHVAICRVKPGTGGVEVVESIDSVESIDLVAEPATTNGLFEGRTVALTVKQLAEALVKHPKVPFRAIKALKQLAEMAGMDTAPAGVDASPADDADPKAALDQAFIDAAVAEMKECMNARGDPAQLKKCLGKLKKMLQAHAEITAEDNEEDSEDADEDREEDEGQTVPEARQVLAAAVMEALSVCETIQFRPDAADLRLIAGTRRSDREALARKLKLAAEPLEKPTSTGRNTIAAGTTKTTEAKPPTDPKAFAEFIRSR